jgi:hypothetical protein
LAIIAKVAMDPFQDSVVYPSTSTEETEFGIDPTLSWLNNLYWAGNPLDANEEGYDSSDVDSHVDKMAGLETAEEAAPVAAHMLNTNGFQFDTINAPSTSEPFSVEAVDLRLSFNSSPSTTPTTNLEQSSPNKHRQIRGSATIQSPAKIGHQIHIQSEAWELTSSHHPIRAARTPRRSARSDATEPSTPAYGKDDTPAVPFAGLRGTTRSDFIPQTAADKVRHTMLLISAFNDSSHSLGREDEIQCLRAQTNERIRRWCEETLNAIITRQSSGVPLCPYLNKRTNY